MRYKTKSLICLFVMLSFNCSSTETDPFIDSMLAKGVDAKLISAYPDSESNSPLFSYEEVLSLGGDVANPQLFQPGEKCLVDSEGNIYFNDESRIKKFSPDGIFLHYISAIGQGPGEIEYPTLVSIIDDFVVLGDWDGNARRKFEVFSTNGNYLERIYRPEISNDQLPETRYTVLQYLGDDKFLFEGSKNETRGNGFVYNELHYGFTDRAGSILKILDMSMKPLITQIKADNAGMPRPLTFSRSPTVYRKDLYMLSRNGKDIYVFNSEGDLDKLFRLNTTEQFTTQEDRDDLYERIASFGIEGLKNMLDNAGFPEKKPAVCDIIVDDSGLIWLRRGDTFRNFASTIRDESFTYIILDQDGKYLGDQILPVKLSKVRGNYAYGFLRTEDGFRVFKKYRLQMN